ncbi:MAG: hypothetical protein KBG20_17425 [Caldilineaceae bacterium]|nr:hypothetical protein [Caldilineaceae bacterium]MBP8109150.1 hypothetical protein [Caldilineaceae bacterium]MBP8121530.1 hypothetical protein [Caldilineaceae bacterium]MBP9074091.1 hypothetical protein [Caldilineaceae bacterium]
MLPNSHIAYTWAALSLAQEHLDFAPDADYRLVALAATGPDLIDKPLAWAYFYKRYRSAVLFAHTIWSFGIALSLGVRGTIGLVYALAYAGHALLDRLWHYHDTFYWPLRGWRFHVWGKRGSEQEAIGLAYWYAFTRRPELWGWELGGFLALGWFVWRHRLYKVKNLVDFVLTGKVKKIGGLA